MYKCVTTQVDSSLLHLFTGSPSPSHTELCHFKVSVLIPLQWGYQTLFCFGFPTYPHTSRMCSPFLNNIKWCSVHDESSFISFSGFYIQDMFLNKLLYFFMVKYYHFWSNAYKLDYIGQSTSTILFLCQNNSTLNYLATITAL
jgi:hypothetical protein